MPVMYPTGIIHRMAPVTSGVRKAYALGDESNVQNPFVRDSIIQLNKNPQRFDLHTCLKNSVDYELKSTMKTQPGRTSSVYYCHLQPALFCGPDSIQTLDLINACGDGEAFCRRNILVASRYDKKGTARRDILKCYTGCTLILQRSSNHY